jgi:hypothetical protein
MEAVSQAGQQSAQTVSEAGQQGAEAANQSAQQAARDAEQSVQAGQQEAQAVSETAQQGAESANGSAQQGAQGGEQVAREGATQASESVATGVPIRGYDNSNVATILEQLDKLSPEELQATRAYEQDNKTQDGLIGQIDRRINAMS